ncbi:MAG: hypothetical protein K9M96_06380 [Deltaproteobacteria bacterium]|nr:hypothetical protein [Deltaproteobacteria bacterium]
MTENLDEKEVISFKEALITQLIQLDTVTRLLMEKGIITEREFFDKLKQVQAEYHDRAQVKD